jgi:5-formyltetrahydrofolate cyclo-ligase
MLLKEGVLPVTTSENSIVENKQSLRRDALERRRLAALESGPAAGIAVRDHLLQWIAGLDGGGRRRIVSGYWPTNQELDIRPTLAALHERGCLCALPVVEAKGKPLLFRRWTPETTLRAAGFGLHEPEATSPVVVPQIVLTPLLAFDQEGFRLGYGAAYYDLTLATLRVQGEVLAVGTGFAAQEVASVPREAHDQRLDAVVTEAGLRLFGGRGKAGR